MVMVSNRKCHFAESHVRGVVGKNLQSLPRYCRNADASVAAAASLLVDNHSADDSFLDTAIHCRGHAHTHGGFGAVQLTHRPSGDRFLPSRIL